MKFPDMIMIRHALQYLDRVSARCRYYQVAVARRRGSTHLTSDCTFQHAFALSRHLSM
jgi:hypothetical protein